MRKVTVLNGRYTRERWNLNACTKLNLRIETEIQLMTRFKDRLFMAEKARLDGQHKWTLTTAPSR